MKLSEPMKYRIALRAGRNYSDYSKLDWAAFL